MQHSPSCSMPQCFRSAGAGPERLLPCFNTQKGLLDAMQAGPEQSWQQRWSLTSPLAPLAVFALSLPSPAGSNYSRMPAEVLRRQVVSLHSRRANRPSGPARLPWSPSSKYRPTQPRSVGWCSLLLAVRHALASTGPSQKNSRWQGFGVKFLAQGGVRQHTKLKALGLRFGVAHIPAWEHRRRLAWSPTAKEPTWSVLQSTHSTGTQQDDPPATTVSRDGLSA